MHSAEPATSYIIPESTTAQLFEEIHSTFRMNSITLRPQQLGIPVQTRAFAPGTSVRRIDEVFKQHYQVGERAVVSDISLDARIDQLEPELNKLKREAL